MICPACQTDNDATAVVCRGCGESLAAAPTAVVVTVELRPGAVFHDRYEILGSLGQGGMGMVYKTRDRSLDEVVAIKILRPDFAQDPKMAERFKSEIRLARKVRHKNVCTIHDFGETRGLLYISMEFIEGVDLKRVIRERGALPPAEAYDVAIQVTEGLQAVHEAGIIHRDLKTPNIMRDGRGTARLMDFGIAKREGAKGSLTVTGQVIGTPEYMSPEQAQGFALDFRTDIYSLGIVTWEMFTGHVPFKGETPISTILKHIHEPPPLEGVAARALPATLRPVLRKALAKEAAERYPTAHDFAEALRQARSPSRRQQPVSTEALTAPTVAVAPEPGRRRSALPWVLGSLAVLVAVGALLRPGRGVPPASSLASPGPAPGSPDVEPLPLDEAPSPAASALPALASPSTPVPSAKAPPPRLEPAATRPTLSPSKPSSAAKPDVGRARPLAPAREAGPRAEGSAAAPAPAAPSPAAAPASTLPAAPAREAPAVAGTGLLQLGIRPWAEVAIDGSVVGSTPLDKIPLAAGRHVVRLRHPAYEPVERSVLIRADQTERLLFDFTSEGVRKR